MKRVIAWVLLLTLCLGLFAGCKQNQTEDPNSTETVGTKDLEAALEYIKTVYRNVGEKTPKDFQRIANVPVNGKDYEVVWTASVGEEYVKIVKGDNGMVTIDINENVEEEVKYVLTATISDANGNKVTHSWNHYLPMAATMADIVEEAYQLASGESMGYEVTLTGVITAVNTPWNDSDKYITVTIAVEGAEDKPIQCYKLTGEGAAALKPNDTITVTGTIKNYNGLIEFDSGCVLESVVEGEASVAPTDPKQILEEAYALPEDGALPYECTLTGVITSVDTEYSSQYKNVTVTIVVGGDTSKPIQCYRLSGDGADKIGEGDTITVTGYIINYKGTVEFSKPNLDNWQDTGTDKPKPEETFTTTLVPQVVTAPQTGVAYKLFLNQKNRGANYYLTGNMSGFYYEATYDPAGAIDVYVEEVSGGYRLYCIKGGVQTYLELVRQYSESTGKWHNNVVFTAAPTKVLKWNSTINSFTCTVDVDGTPTEFYLGTYSNYNTFSASDISRITGANAGAMDTENFVARLATLKETKVSEAEKAYEQLKIDYPAADSVTDTTEDFTRKSVYDIDGKKVNVAWAVDNEAVTVEDNGDGTVTVKIVRTEEDIEYTLTATITDGSKEYTASWNCAVPALLPATPKEIVEAAYALESGDAMAEPVTLSGIVAKIDSEYSSTHNNISVVIVIEDMMDKPILCYRLTGDGIDKIAVGDNITVTGTIKNYNGTIEFHQGCTMDARMTMAEIVDAAYALEAGESLEQGYALIGVITSVDNEYSETWGNITVTIAVDGVGEDKPIQCFRLEGEGVAELAEGYLVAVYGTLKNYNGTYEFDAGCILLDYAAPETEEEDPYITKPAATHEVGVGYKLAMDQAQLGTTLYFSGAMDGYYLGTTDNLSEAVDVYLEAVYGEAAEGEEAPLVGYNFYFMDGETKKYIVVYKSGDYTNIKIAEEAGLAFTFNEEVNTYVVDVEGTVCYLGTYGTKTDIRPSAISYITGDNASKVGVSQFVAYFAEKAPAAEDLENVAPPVEVEVGYKFYLEQVGLGKILYFNGAMDGYYLGTTEDLSEAVDVYKEAVYGEAAEGEEAPVVGYNFYFLEGDVKKYIVVYKSGDYTNVKIAEEAGLPFTFSEEANTYVVDVEGTVCYLGTYGTKTDIRPSAISFITGENASKVGVSQFVVQFGTVVLKEIGTTAVETPEVGVGYKLAMDQAKLGTTLYFNGAMDGYYLGTTDNLFDAVDVYLEAVYGEAAEGEDAPLAGYNFYFMDGETKNYIVVYKSGDYTNIKIAEEAGLPFTFSEEANTFVVDVEGTECYLGTYGTKTDIRPSAISYITGDNASNVGVSQFVAYFAEVGFVTETVSE